MCFVLVLQGSTRIGQDRHVTFCEGKSYIQSPDAEDFEDDHVWRGRFSVPCVSAPRRRKGEKTQPYRDYVCDGVWPPVCSMEEIGRIPKKEQLEQMTNAVVNKPDQKEHHCKYQYNIS